MLSMVIWKPERGGNRTIQFYSIVLEEVYLLMNYAKADCKYLTPTITRFLNSFDILDNTRLPNVCAR